MRYFKHYIFFLAFWLCPAFLFAQVSPESVNKAKLVESTEAVLGKTSINWKAIPVSDQQKNDLKEKLKATGTIPDTLHIGSVLKDGEQFWVIPNIAPSKSETFSYVLYLNARKEITGVDVLEYRESYGYEIDYPFFREQFYGISKPDKIRFRRSIQNISGATISARSITYSVRDLLLLVQTVGMN